MNVLYLDVIQVPASFRSGYLPRAKRFEYCSDKWFSEDVDGFAVSIHPSAAGSSRGLLLGLPNPIFAIFARIQSTGIE
jgi:hypothetical protein